MKSHATPVTRHPPGIRLFDRTPAPPSMPIARTARTGSCAVTMVSVRHIGRDLPALCPFCPGSAVHFSPYVRAARHCVRPDAPPADLSIAQSTRSISVNCAIDRNMLEADRLLSVSAEDSTPYEGQIPSTNWILVTPGTVGLAGPRKTRRAAVSAIRRVVNGGGAGNRTRVLQYLTRTSPSAACICFSQPRRSRRQDADGLSHC
jgi:hypothetical protein